jgi:dTDP-glucose pyrophosphorylase
MKLNKNFILSSVSTIEQSILQLDKLTLKGLYPVLIVVDDSMKLIGTVTDGDIRRFLIKNHNFTEVVTKAANLSPIFTRVGNSIDRKLLEQFKIVPLLDELDRVVDILTSQFMVQKTLGHVPLVINAGGIGSRLYPYTKVLPKPLIPVGENPIIDHIIQSFVNYGVTSIKVILNYKKILIRSYIDDVWSRLNISYVEESKPLGTVGGLSLLDFSQSKSPFFVLTNCDVTIDHNIESIVDYHVKNRNEITVVSVIYEDKIPYGVLEVNGDSMLSTIHEKPEKSLLISAGVYIINTSLLSLIKTNTYLDMDVFLKKVIKKGYQVGVYPIQSDHWYDMGTIDGLTKMRERIGAPISHI